MTRSYVPTGSVCLSLNAVHPFHGLAEPVALFPRIFTEKIALLGVRSSSIPVTWDYKELAGMELSPYPQLLLPPK